MSSGQDLSRRTALKLGGAAAASALLPPLAWAQGRDGLHGLSIFGDLKYGPEFTHFDYLVPDAPKGASNLATPITVRMSGYRQKRAAAPLSPSGATPFSLCA